ncbi:MAG: histidine kinase [Limnothrix sp. RL_2_0]|nr:histidine kinase [Limnothrix sp. RL_2_0]
MDAASQQKILGYFIEEAKEHLETLEQGILELSDVIHDSERVNELFRAAHSVKGGAAMLGYTSIQKTAHRLEDAFKVFKDNEIEVDQQLESHFLSANDVLSELIEKLQSPFGLQEADGKKIVAAAEPQFIALQKYLDQLVNGEVATTPQPIPAAAPVRHTSSASLGEQLRDHLRQMLDLFKQDDTPTHRQQLQKVCVELAKLDKDTKAWQTILKAAHKAIANQSHSFNLLAPVVIKELKYAGDQLELDEKEQISLSPELKGLAIAKVPQILLSVEPKHAAQTIVKAFNKKQIAQLIKILSTQT